jgi:hypothetical protein
MADPDPGGDREELRCPSCGRPARPEDTKRCPICGRRVCLACLKPYGHHMQVCEECRMAEW